MKQMTRLLHLQMTKAFFMLVGENNKFKSTKGLEKVLKVYKTTKCIYQMNGSTAYLM